ncbi:MAG: M12 family metallo-peptidase [Fulvivirga sp.]|uniref:reprolysin-like metallopeptidase n=1 Tax=Fulvivirga sp. TaxID=1931237 RepID=UPI0032EE74BB
MKKINFFFTVTLSLASHLLMGQNFWSEVKSNTNERKEISIATRTSKLYRLDVAGLKSNIAPSKSNTITIPLPDGDLIEVVLKESNTMSQELKLKYPEIKAYVGTSTDGKYSGRFDLTPKGFHGMFRSPQGTVFIDPLNLKTKDEYQVYFKKDFIPDEQLFLNDDVLPGDSKVDLKPTSNNRLSERSSGTELRTYSIAITCTGEYTAFHGGTVPDALSAIVTTMNRVGGIYEREVGIAFELIGDTDLLIYTDANTDPYTNGDASAYINEVQDNIDDIIGVGNYDVGHGFSTGAGGLAGPGPCINGSNATGVTGTNTPIGDPYDVDYVAHEIGHQFSANHTFNGTSGSCTGGNRNAGTAYEPGSGTTILAYAGICSTQNIQSNSDPYFHTASYDEILAYSVDGSGNNCPTITSTGNNPPTVDAGESGFAIPANTPFKLTGSGVDPDGDELTFGWEQYDLGPAGAPDSPSGNAPLFRSFNPTTEPTRYFPQLSDIINNTQTIGEILPDNDRSLTFRLTARDNKDGGGGVNYDELSFDVSAGAGPFVVTSFNSSTEVIALSNAVLTWDVAGTDQQPINCQNVNVLLSVDGGLTYPHTIKSNIPNDGTELIVIPDVTTVNARIMIEAVDNVFFDINDSDFSIVAPSDPDYNINVITSSTEFCSPDDGQFVINIGSILSYNDDVTLSVNGLTDGLTSQFSSNPVTPGNDVTLFIEDTNLGADGEYNITLVTNSTSGSKETELTFTIYDEEVEEIVLTSPSNNETDVELFPTLSWEPLPGFNTYQIDIATDIDFNDIVQSKSGLTSANFVADKLEANTTYFWRVNGTNTCQSADFVAGSFLTLEIDCVTTASTDTPIDISPDGPNTITSTIEVASCGRLEEIRVIGLSGTHTYVSDLTVSLTSPSGTTVVLFSGICGDLSNFDINFDEFASSSTINCPPTDQNTYIPLESFENFYGEEISGYWILTVEDGFNLDGGALEEWSLNICVANNLSILNAPSNLIASNEENSEVQLTWTDNSNNETGFHIERSMSNDLFFETIDQTIENATAYIDNSLTEEDTYFYRVRAFSDNCVSQPSNQEEFLFITIPERPMNLIAEAIDLNQINISWEDLADNEQNYSIERSVGDNSNFVEIASVEANSISYEDNNLDELTEYFYRVRASNLGGESGYSNEASASTLVLSTDLHLFNGIIISPNPFEHSINIRIDKNSSDLGIIIYDSKGRQIKASQIINDSEMTVDLSSHPNGIYLIRISDNAESNVYKVIKSSIN